jgi:hypothetical protein
MNIHRTGEGLLTFLNELPDELLSHLLQTSRNRQFREVSQRFRRLYDDPRTMLPSDIRSWASQPVELDGFDSDSGDGYGTATSTTTYLPELLKLVRFLNAAQDSVEIYDLIRNWVVQERIGLKKTIAFLRGGIFEHLQQADPSYTLADMDRDYNFSFPQPDTWGVLWD